MAIGGKFLGGMAPALAFGLTITDGAFLLYWTLAALHALGLFEIPQSWLYANADDARVVAWNWSFFPLDVAFSLTGLVAVRLSRRNIGVWRLFALISLILTMVAGGMAVGYWALLGEFDLFWMGANMLLLLWPIPFLASLVRDLGVATSTLSEPAAKDAP